ncbi:MAG: hypothetical protein OXF79_30975 [Chloroflexi bacterium]|nr:hypothetical protein [Chloroflexota bacterium]
MAETEGSPSPSDGAEASFSLMGRIVQTVGAARRWWRLAILNLALVGATTCGESPTGPTYRVPDVEGTYEGIVEATYSQTEVSFSVVFRIIAVQAGSELSITASAQDEDGDRFALWEVIGTVTSSGRLTSTTGFFHRFAGDDYCGDYRTTSLNLLFAGVTAEYTEDVATEDCGLAHFDGVLRR